MERLSRFCHGVIQTLWPTYCFICQKVNARSVCNTCQEAINRDPAIATLPLRCYQCGRRIAAWTSSHNHPLCGQCIANPPAFDRTIVFADYVDPYAGLVTRLKFGGQLELVPWLAQCLSQSLQSQLMGMRWDQSSTVITAVPMSDDHLLERGYNQAWLLAQSVAKTLACQARPQLVVKVRKTLPQVGLNRQARLQNLKNAFAVDNPLFFKTIRQVVVIDDVLTTGTTLNEMARVLKRHGVEQVINGVILRTQEK